METKKCPICDSGPVAFFLKKDGYPFSVCDNCHLVFMNPLPESGDLIENFYSKKSGYHAAAAQQVKEIKKYNRKFIKIICRLVRFGARGNLLDVGCANGEFLFLAKKHGFNVYGVEANTHTAGIAQDNGLPVFNGTLEQARLEESSFSVIYLGDVIEHVTDPVALLKECKRILKKEGMIVVSTPNTDCFWVLATQYICHWFKFPWSVLHPPYHIYLFSEANFRKLMQMLDFKILEVAYHHVSLRHELGVTGLFKKYKSQKSITALLYMALVFFTYAMIYGVDFLLKPFLKKSFEMVVFAKS